MIKQKNTIIVDFPEMTAEQIYEESGNKAGKNKLFYNTSWYKNEDFFTKEKTRKGKREIILELQYVDESWNECDRLRGDLEMLNFAEVMYLLWKKKEMRVLLNSSNNICYTWASSRSTDGYLVYLGSFDSEGVYGNGWRPDYRHGYLGVSLSRSVETLVSSDSPFDSLEKRVRALETKFMKYDVDFLTP